MHANWIINFDFSDQEAFGPPHEKKLKLYKQVTMQTYNGNSENDAIVKSPKAKNCSLFRWMGF